MKKSLLVCALALVGGCAAPPYLFNAQGTPVGLAEGVHVGQVVAVPQMLLEDSRCSMNARCVWAGRVVLSTRIYGPGFDETLPLTLGEPHALHGTTIMLASAQPERQTGVNTEVPFYRFTFEGGT